MRAQKIKPQTLDADRIHRYLANIPRWMGGRAVEGTGLENRQTGNRLVGSNPTPSAS